MSSEHLFLKHMLSPKATRRWGKWGSAGEVETLFVFQAIKKPFVPQYGTVLYTTESGQTVDRLVDNKQSLNTSFVTYQKAVVDILGEGYQPCSPAGHPSFHLESRRYHRLSRIRTHTRSGVFASVASQTFAVC